MTTSNHSLILFLASKSRRLYTEFLPPQHLAAGPACSSTGHSLARWQWLQKLGPQKKERPGQGPQSVLQLPFKLATESLPCTNRGTCRECKRRHHTTLHDPAKVVTPPAATTPASTNSTPSTEEVSNRVIRQPLLAAATASPMTLHEVSPHCSRHSVEQANQPAHQNLY